MAKAIYPGTFDPITLGHLDVIREASKIFDELIVAVLVNPKKTPLFEAEERKRLIEKAVTELPSKNIKVMYSEKAAVTVARENNANVLIRGLRLTSDYEQELFLAMNNRELDQNIQTLFFPPNQKHIHISSTVVREILGLNPNNLKEIMNEYLPNSIVDEIVNKKLNEN